MMSRNLEYIANEDREFLTVIKAALLAFVNTPSPQVAIEFARRVVRVILRPSFLELESLVKAAKKEVEEMEENKKKIIIKRVKKVHAEHHGGGHGKWLMPSSVTAMMAFFLLMWLLNMTSQDKRAVLAMYFKHFSLFDKGGKSFMEEGGLRPVGHNVGMDDVVDAGDMKAALQMTSLPQS